MLLLERKDSESKHGIRNPPQSCKNSNEDERALQSCRTPSKEILLKATEALCHTDILIHSEKKYYLLQDLPQQKIIVRGLTSCLSIASM